MAMVRSLVLRRLPGVGRSGAAGAAYALLYSVDTPEEARDLIEKLIDGGGTEGMPFDRAPWGGWYGQVFDRFGVMWSFSAEDASA